MALNYSVALRPNPLKKDEPAKAYATAQVNGELSLKQLSRRVSMQTTVSRADVVAVLISTVENLLDALQEGKQVDFPITTPLGPSVKSTGGIPSRLHPPPGSACTL